MRGLICAAGALAVTGLAGVATGLALARAGAPERPAVRKPADRIVVPDLVGKPVTRKIGGSIVVLTYLADENKVCVIAPIIRFSIVPGAQEYILAWKDGGVLEGRTVTLPLQAAGPTERDKGQIALAGDFSGAPCTDTGPTIGYYEGRFTFVSAEAVLKRLAPVRRKVVAPPSPFRDAPPDTVARITLLQGMVAVERRGTGPAEPLTNGEFLQSGDLIVTSPGSRVDLEFAVGGEGGVLNGQSVTVGERSLNGTTSSTSLLYKAFVEPGVLKQDIEISPSGPGSSIKG